MRNACTGAASMVVLCAFATAQTSTQPLRTPTIDDVVSIERVSEVEISPDGRRVVYGVTSADFEADAFVTQLWLGDAMTKKTFQLTRGDASASGAQCSPDGQWIAFLSAREEDQAQIHLIRADGGEAFPITESPAAISSLRWSPDGTTIAYAAPEPQSDAVEARDEYYGDYEVVRREYRHVHLYTIQVAEAMDGPIEGTQRTRGHEFSLGAFSWSPDGTRIAFDATTTPDLIHLHTRDLYVLSLRGDSVRKIANDIGPESSPHWSPDGEQIMYATVPGRREYFPYNQELAIVRADGTGARVVTGSFDENAWPIAWKRSGIYFQALDKTAAHLYRISPFTGVIERVSAPGDLLGESFSLNADASAFAYTAGTPAALSEVFVEREGYASPIQLTTFTTQIEELDLGKREVIRWTSKDGTAIEGILHKPRRFLPFRKYPLLVVIHGGPTGTDRPAMLQGTRYYPVDIWTSRGALVLRVNYRGSGGYGEDFRALNVRNLGVGDAWDVESGIEHLIAQGAVDPKRIGCMGWSQGGYISAFLTTHSETFAAVSVGAGISNWATYYYNTDITPFTINYLGADPASDPGIYAKTSPMTNILRAKTPTLIQHGENDARVPIANAYELRQGLEDRGVPVEMIVYEGFGHGINKPRALRAVLQHNLDWFNHYLWGDPLPDWIAPDVPQDESNENR